MEGFDYAKLGKYEWVNLEKYAYAHIVGTPISIENAMEIIRRTDQFFNQPCGNHREYVKKAEELFGLKRDMDSSDYFDRLWDFYERWGYIHTEQIRNFWVSFPMLHGWCQPDGTIFYQKGLGKDPSIRAVYQDWEKLAAAFPFLDLGCVVYNGPRSKDDITPLVAFRVKDGTSRMVDPNEEDVLADFKHLQPSQWEKPKSEKESKVRSKEDEVAFPFSQLVEWNWKYNRK